MSPRQINEDGGRQIRKVWLGAKGLRWPMDWTFEEWGLALLTLLAGLVLLTFIVPAGVVVGAGGYGVARAVSRVTAPEAPRRHFWTILGCVAGACLLFSADPLTWIRPLWIPFAALAAFLLPILAVRWLGPYLNWNRPMAYWVRLPLQVSRGPRQDEPRAIDPSRLTLGMDLRSMDRDDLPLTTILSPAKGGKPPLVRYETEPLVIVPVRKRARRQWIERTPDGFRVGRTEYRIEWTF